MSSSVQECVFYRPELTEKWGPHKIVIRFWKISFSQTVDEKNGVIRLVAYSQSYVHQKNGSFYILFAGYSKSVPVWERYLSASQVLFGPFRKCYGLCTMD